MKSLMDAGDTWRMVMTTVEENMRLMQTLDDAWNTQDWATFEKRHAKDVDVFWPGQEKPTHSRPSHKEESIAFFKIFPDNKVGNRPYKIFFGEGNYTCSVADFTGTFKGPMTAPDGKVIPPNGKKFKIEFCTVAHWKNGEIIEEKLFYDKIAMMQQLGLM